jgi:hypothetical protein
MRLLHWSKSRHLDFQACPRRFFYSEIAAPRNPTIAMLADRMTAALLRHEVVRCCVRDIVGAEGDPHTALLAALQSCETQLAHSIKNPLDVNAQYSIAEACLTNFVNSILPDVTQAKVLYVSNGDPVEFLYDGLTMFAVPELVLDKGDQIEILNWKTGSSNFRKDDDLMLRAGGLTCWARSILKEVVKPIVVTDAYLREGPNPTTYSVNLSDSEVRAFVAQAKEMSQAYSVSARVADFPARPDLNTCRFCNFKDICPDYAAITEINYEIATINAAIAEVKQQREDALTGAAGEIRSVFLSHVSEDKEHIVRPFARALEAEGISYWLDEAELQWGDSLSRGINKGLAISEFVVAFLSESFITRGWPQAELGTALTAQTSTGRKKLLPIMVAERSAVVREFPMLGDLLHKNWSDGHEQIIRELKIILPS